jgi:hypothetical protein
MALTDREIIKERQTGQVQSYGVAGSAKDAVAATHTRSINCNKVGTENAATNIAETVICTVNRKSRLASVKYLTNSTVPGNATDSMLFTIAKRTAGAAAVTVATWNTDTGAQSTITALVPASFPVVANADAILAAGDILTYTVRKVAAGKLLDPAVFTVDLEEV